MSETNNVVKPTVARRGIATARGTQRLKFSHSDAKSNGLFIAHLESVDVTKIKIGEDTTGLVSFNGLEIPRIRFTFASNEQDEAKRRFVTLSFMPVESNANTIPSGKESWKVNQVFDWLNHILNVFVLKGREFTEEEINALSLTYTDFDETNQYVPVDVDDVISSWSTVFNNVERMLNAGKDDKPVYKNSNGVSIPLWIKLIRYNKSKKNGWSAVSNGDLAFPTFVGEGCIEVFKPNELPAIKLNVANECITPKDIEPKKKEPNMPMGGNPMGMGGVNLQGFGSEQAFGANSFNDGFVEDMPDFNV